MKKIFALLIVAALLVAAFAVTPSADKVNENINVEFLSVAPNTNGVVERGEYGKAIVEYRPEYKDDFDGVLHDHDKYDDWGFDFYAGWDEENLYLAWIAYTDVHAGLPVEVKNAKGSGWMWEFSCTQFILTPGAPANGTTHYQTEGAYVGDYMECGLTLMDNGETEKVIWATFKGGESITANDWDGLVTRDEDKKETHYEVRIPWQKSGVPVVGNGHQFGITFAVAAQEQYANDIDGFPATGTVKPGMLEWQDGILGGKNADAAGVITLVGAPEGVEISVAPVLPEGPVPANCTDESVKLGIDSVNTGIQEDKSTVIMDPSRHADYNTRYTALLLLAPVEGEEDTYYIAEKLIGSTGEDLVFETELTDGMIAAAFHGDGTESEAAQRKAAAAALEVGTKLHLFGVAEGRLAYSNAMLYTVAGEEPVGGDDSSEVIDESSEEIVESSEETVESSEEPDESSEESAPAESAAESKAEESKAEEEKGGLGTGAIIAIIVAAVAVVGAAAAFIIKKKKA